MKELRGTRGDPAYARLRDALAAEPLPALVCDLDAFDRNLAAVARLAGGAPVRLATKSLRCLALVRRALEAPGVRGLMAYSAREAVALVDRGLDDVLVAYPTVDRAAAAEVAARVRLGKRVALVVDDAAQLPALEAAARAAGGALPLCLDVDLSLTLPGLHFGVRRSPVRTPAAAVALAREVARRPGLALAGVLAYEAQVSGLPDRGRGALDPVVRALKARSIRLARSRRAAVLAALRAAGHPVPWVNGGGSGSLASTAADPSVTELTAGSALFGPTCLDGLDPPPFEPALAFALEVVRRPAPGLVTCFAGGYVASGPAGGDKLPSPWLPPGLALLPHEGAGEVQTPLRVPPGLELALGAPVFFRHAKAGEPCERFSTIALVSGDRVVERVPTYRGEGWSFG